MTRRVRALVLLLALAWLLPGAHPSPHAHAQTPAVSDGEKIFERFAGRVLKLRIVEVESGAKSAIGTGFVVGRANEFATNYHVIAHLVREPERYRAEWVDAEGQGHVATLLGFDVVHDLALLRSEKEIARPFRLYTGVLQNGRRIFAVGDPYDLGMSIVEGVYNGRLDNSRTERIHFTGSLNAGMSGGPALLEDGTVMGINVASAGNQVSFVVPASALRALQERVHALSYALPENRMHELRDQLWAHQAEYFGELLSLSPSEVRIGALTAPGKLAPFFTCWGDLDEEDLYRRRTHYCGTHERIFLFEDYVSNVVRLRHRQLESTALSPVRFHQLYSRSFENNWSELEGDEDDFGEFRCDTDLVATDGLRWKAVFCARQYRELEGLYDVVFKAARISTEAAGFETALVMTAVSFENARALAQRHLQGIRWSE